MLDKQAGRRFAPFIHGEAVAAQHQEVGLVGIRDAQRGLAGVALRTPLTYSAALSHLVGVPVYLKCEQLQRSGAFKIRGAYTAIRRRLEAGHSGGVITYSSGNHGQAVALAAQRLGVRAVVVMPTTAPQVKVGGVSCWGAEVVLEGRTSAERQAWAEAHAAATGLAVIPPFDDRDVVEGQGTVGLEIAEQQPDIEHVVAPAGGGGLASGVAAALSALRPRVRVHVVEPEGAPTVAAALDAGRPVMLEQADSIADGLLPLEVGHLPFKLLTAAGVDAVQVDDDAIRRATRWFLDEMRLLVEPSGAATAAAVMSARIRFDGPAALIVSGGNIALETVAQWG